jgi:hypothetical protein
VKRLPRYIALERPWLRSWLLLGGIGIAAWAPFALLVLWVLA